MNRLAMAHPTKWVVKLGGSLAATPELKKWLQVLAAHGKGQVIIVPGGGPFADQVRIAQQQWGFDNTTAHKMALLAMEQYGLMLSRIETDLVVVHSLIDINAVLSSQRLALWLPARMLFDSSELPLNWDITSDSIAAWLATKTNATNLLLIKHQAAEINTSNLDDLEINGTVDSGFKQFILDACFHVSILGKSDSGTFSLNFAEGLTDLTDN